jgi:hypothetical protein
MGNIKMYVREAGFEGVDWIGLDCVDYDLLGIDPVQYRG